MKSTVMRKTIIFSAVLSLFLLVPASITWAQKISSEKGLTTAVFEMPQGKIKIYLPDDIRPGDVISGALIIEPFGNNPTTISKNLIELNKTSVNINAKRYGLMGTTPRVFTRLFDESLVRIQLFSENNQLVHDITSNGSDAKFYKNYNDGSTNPYCFPSHIMASAPFRITGSFDGDIANTQCNLNNQPMQILAESPRSCIASFSSSVTGPQYLAIQEKGETKCNGSTNVVNMDVSVPKTNLRKGESTTIHVMITGLENLKDTATLTLSNTTPGIVTMQPSNDVVIFFTPDSVGNGTFNRQFDVKSITTGDFVVIVNLNLPDVADRPVNYYDLPKTGGDNKTDTVPCKDLEDALKKMEDALQGLKDELESIDGQIRNAKLALIDCNIALEVALKEYYTAKKAFDFQERRIGYFKTDKKAIPPAVQKDHDDAQKAKDDASKKWSDQNKKCKALEQKIAGLEARKLSLPGLIKSLEEDIGKLKTEIEKCKEKEAAKKKKAEDDKKRAEDEAAAKAAAKKTEADAKRESIETNRYLLQNIYSLGLISSKEFWETPGITSWLPEILEKPIGDIAEEIGKSTIPADAIPALAGVYQVIGMLLDPCTNAGSTKTINRLKNMINTRTTLNYTDEEALSKTEKMCEMLKKIKALAAAAGKK